MLGSICDDCPHKIFTQLTIRSPNITRHNDPNNRAEVMFIEAKEDNRCFSFSYEFNVEWAFFSPE